MDAVTLTRQVLDVLPPTPAGQRAAWVWQRVQAIALGTAVPDRSELEEHYGQEWLDEVPMGESFARMASLMSVMRDVRVEPAAADEVRLVVGLAEARPGGSGASWTRLRRTASFSKSCRPRCRQIRMSIG